MRKTIKADLSNYRAAKNQTEVMLSKQMIIVDKEGKSIQQGDPKLIREKYENFDLFYKEVAELIKNNKIFVR